MVAGYSLTSPLLLCLPTHFYYHFEGSQTLSPLYPHLYSRPRSRSRSHPCTHAYFRPRPRSVITPPPFPLTVSFFPSPLSGSPFGTTSSGRHHVLRQKLLVTCRRHLLPAEIIPRTKWQCLIFYSVFFLMRRILNRSSSLSSLSVIVPFNVSDPVLVPVSATDLVSVPTPIPVPV